MNRRVLKELKAWASDKPRFLVIFVLQVLPDIDEVTGILQAVAKLEEIEKVFPRGDLNQWLANYKTHRAWCERVCVATGFVDDEGEPLSQVGDILRKEAREAASDPEAFAGKLRDIYTPDELRDLVVESNEVWEETVTESLHEAAGGESQDEPSHEELEDISESPSFAFFLRIWLPCWVHHQKHPTLLYRAARQGDTDAIDALLRLDKTLLLDRTIMRHVMDSAGKKTRGLARQYTTAIHGRPRGRNTAPKIKKRMAALVVQWSAEAGFPIEVPEVQRLYNILALKEGELADRDLPVGDSFYKAVKREPKWPSLPHGQKKK